MFLVPPPSPAGNAARGPLRPLRPHRTRVFRAGLRLFRVAGALQTGAESVALSERSKREFAFYRQGRMKFLHRKLFCPRDRNVVHYELFT